MTVDYVHLSPVILTDSMFFEMLPTLVTTGTSVQRQIAYLLAEQQMIQHLETFLIPTSVTGTYLWSTPARSIRLDHGYISSVNRIVVTSFDGLCNCDISENAACAVIRSGWGLIDARVTSYAVRAKCGACASGYFYQAIVTYTAGLATGTSSQDKSLHVALAKIAEINLIELIDPGAAEGGPGDPGIESWSSLGYSQKRHEIKTFPWGASSNANFAGRLVKHLKRIRPLRL